MKKIIYIIILMMLNGVYIYAQKDSTNKFISRISIGVFIMPQYVISTLRATEYLTINHSKVVAKGWNSGVYSEYYFSYRRRMQVGLLYHYLEGNKILGNENIGIGFYICPPGDTNCYYFREKQYHLEFPLQYKYYLRKK